jgi:hypothetical protein
MGAAHGLQLTKTKPKPMIVDLILFAGSIILLAFVVLAPW